MRTEEPTAKPTATEHAENDREFEFDEDSIVWLNVTKSGKGIKIVTPDDRMFISSLSNLKKLVSGKYKGVKFTELVEVVS